MFYGIGVGVGDKDTVTKKAVDILKTLDILYVPIAKKNNGFSVAFEIVKDYLSNKTEIKERYFPMKWDTTELIESWNNIAGEIEADTVSGKNTGFITIGDPMLYSTYIYLLKLLRNKIKITTIPGITSFLDIAAANNFPLAEGENPLVIVPATIGIERLRDYIEKENSIVIMKVYKNFDDVVSILVKNKLEKCSLVVSNSSKNTETVYTDLSNIKKTDVSYFTTILINKKWEI